MKSGTVLLKIYKNEKLDKILEQFSLKVLLYRQRLEFYLNHNYEGRYVMNNKFAKKLLAVTIAASMMVVPVVAGATDSTSGNSSSSETTATVEEVKAPQTANVVAGTKSTVAGAIYVNEATGLAVTTPASALAPAGATAFLKAYSVNAKSAPASAKVAADYVGAQGGKQVAFFNLELGYMQNKKFVRAAQDQTFDMVIGVKNAANSTLEGLQILPGGTALSLQDADTAANTFTATGLKAGLSAICVYSK